MKVTLPFLILLFCFYSSIFSSYAYEERNLLQKKAEIMDLKNQILPKEQWITYPDYADRTGWDKLLNENKKDLIVNGEKYVNYDWKVVKATDYLGYIRTGNRSEMEAVAGRNHTALATLFMAELAEGEGRFLDQVINGVFALCEQTTWSLSAHLTLQRKGSGFPNHTENVIDLVAADMGSMLAWVYHFLHKEFDKVHPFISLRLYDELDKRIMRAYMETNHYWWMAVNLSPGGLVNNWNPWCNSNVLQTFLLLEENPERLYQGVMKTLISTDKFINYTHSDGACEEGPSYWGHAAGKLYDYLQIIYDATGGKLSLFDEPIIKNMGEYISRSYVGDGWVVNFADASAKGGFDYRLIYRYGQAVSSDEMMGFAFYLKDKTPQKLSVSRDMWRTLAGISTDILMGGETLSYTAPTVTWYPETEFCYIREGDLFFASKGGFNDESHNHNDVGSFSVYYQQVPLFIDVGVGTYSAKTFSSERYTLWYMQSNYHNLPLVNGYPQQNGKMYKALNTAFDGRRKTFRMQLEQAYPKAAGIEHWKRSYKVAPQTVVINDDFRIEDAQKPNHINFMVWGEADVSKEGQVIVRKEHVQAILTYDKKRFQVLTERVEIDDRRLSNVWGESVTRVTLVAKEVEKKGKYEFKIRLSENES